MRSFLFFVEDSFHEEYLTALLRRFSTDRNIPIDPRPYSARGGITKMHHEFKEFLRDVRKDREPLPDAILVATDANCMGYNERRKIMEEVTEGFDQIRELVLYAIPDPHIERWMMVDPNAFQSVFGVGCDLPTYKCEKGYYKRLLAESIRKAGTQAPLGGREFAADVIQNMNLPYAQQQDASFRLLLRDLRALFNRWGQQ